MKELLEREFPGLKLTFDRPYRELTTLGVGGKLPILAEPENAETLGRLLVFLRKRGIPFFILGGGSNLVGMDEPYDGVAVRLERKAFCGIRRDGDRLVCGARASLPEAAATAAKAGLSGLAHLAGIPGSVGGAVRMNASCRGTATGELVELVSGVTYDGKPWSARGADLEWQYRKGGVPEDAVVTSVTFKLAPGDAETELAALEAERAKRRATEPEGRSAGCAFRNVSPEEPAGMLIDRCGLRGTRIGGVEISAKHANYIVNASGEATEAEFLTIARLARRAVKERFGHELKPEVRFISRASERALLADAPAPAVKAKPTANSALLALCRWLYRLTILLAAAVLVSVGCAIRPTSSAAAWMLYAGAALLVLSEAVYSTLKRLEKR
jgi:UDP-N-acetylenolpyruvoylglucosamine reductase